MKKLTTQEFIEKAKKIHDNKYDYSEVDYTGAGNNIIVICKDHGKFNIKPYNHLSGQGCPKCGIEKRSKSRTIEISKDDFLKQATEKFGEQYTYEKTNYINKNTKIIVTCKDHGDFEILPCRFLGDKYPCPKCANNRIKTTETFINEAIQKYGDKFDYSLVNYSGAYNQINLICHELDENGNEHGIFQTTPVKHLYGNDICPKCRQTYRYTMETCINKIKQIYKDKYDCKDVIYKNCEEPIILYCKKHGKFERSAHWLFTHKDDACPQCRKEKIFENHPTRILAANAFIEKAKKIHGEKYDYSNVNYITAKQPVSIICKKHGEFYQTPNKHLGGENCPKCKESILETHMRAALEQNNIKYIQEKRFQWLGLQRLDFYLPDYNIAIECQGIQHFKQMNIYNNDENSLFNTHEMDQKKLNKCLENNVPILYYTETSYNIFLNNKVYHNTQELINYIINQYGTIS